MKIAETILASLLLIGLFVDLGKSAEVLSEEKSKAPLKTFPSQVIFVSTMKNNNSKNPGMISGQCTKKRVDQLPLNEGLELLLKDRLEQLECKFVQALYTIKQRGDAYSVHISVFRQTFTRTSNTAQWVSTEGPRGLCGEVDISTLESGSGDDHLWTYTSRRVYTDTLTQPCKELPKETKETFSWKNPALTIGGKKLEDLMISFPSDW